MHIDFYFFVIGIDDRRDDKMKHSEEWEAVL